MSLKGIKIRKATVDDLPILLAFEQGIIEVERAYDDYLKDEKISYYDIKKLILQDDSEVLVAVVNDHLIASGYARIVKSKTYLKHEYHTFLGFMYVASEYRGKGVNQLIIDGLAAWSQSKNIHTMCLEVYDENEAAIKAYEKVGFEKNIIQMKIELE